MNQDFLKILSIRLPIPLLCVLSGQRHEDPLSSENFFLMCKVTLLINRKTVVQYKQGGDLMTYKDWGSEYYDLAESLGRLIVEIKEHIAHANSAEKRRLMELADLYRQEKSEVLDIARHLSKRGDVPV
jgi:hypothetical protein